MAPAPFPRAGRHRGETDPRPHVTEALLNPEPHTTTIDPTDPRIRSNQPNVTRAGVAHYLNNPDHLYADEHSRGNRVPVFWHTRSGNGEEQLVAMSGHHRATAAALAGRQFTAVVARDPRLDADKAS
jgi:hypothetical protein